MTLNKNRVSDAPQPVALYTDPDTGKKHIRKTRRDKNGMIYFPFGYDINTIEGAVPGAKGKSGYNTEKLISVNGKLLLGRRLIQKLISVGNSFLITLNREVLIFCL